MAQRLSDEDIRLLLQRMALKPRDRLATRRFQEHRKEISDFIQEQTEKGNDDLAQFAATTISAYEPVTEQKRYHCPISLSENPFFRFAMYVVVLSSLAAAGYYVYTLFEGRSKPMAEEHQQNTQRLIDNPKRFIEEHHSPKKD